MRATRILIRRSTLILPVNVPRFIEKAHLRGADAVMLDLEDAVPLGEKNAARRRVLEATLLVARGGAEVFVRVNHDAVLLADDLEAALRRGTASADLDGAMVDTPVYQRARCILEQATAIAEVETRKADALARLG